MRMQMKSAPHGKNELSIHIQEPWVLVSVGTTERGLITYEEAVCLLLKDAEEREQEPLMRYGDAEPAVYMGVSNEGALFDEETVLLLMPTKYKRD